MIPRIRKLFFARIGHLRLRMTSFDIHSFQGVHNTKEEAKVVIKNPEVVESVHSSSVCSLAASTHHHPSTCPSCISKVASFDGIEARSTPSSANPLKTDAWNYTTTLNSQDRKKGKQRNNIEATLKSRELLRNYKSRRTRSLERNHRHLVVIDPSNER